MTTAIEQTGKLVGTVVTGREGFDEVLAALAVSEVVCLDTETTGLSPYGGDVLCGVGLQTKMDGDVWYLPFRHQGEYHEASEYENLPEEWLAELTEAISGVRQIVGFNVKFDLKFLANDGFELRPEHKLVDVHVMARLSCPERWPPGGLGLQSMENRFIKPGAGEYNNHLKTWMREKKLWVDSRKVRLYSHVPIDILGEYCCKDVWGTSKLKGILQSIIKSSDQVGVWGGEVESTWDFFRAESKGVKIDLTYCEEAIGHVTVRMEAIVEEVHELTGAYFNFNSNPQITKAMNAVGVFSPVLTEGGKDKDPDKKQQSWGKEAMKTMGQSTHAALPLIREYLTLKSLAGTFLQTFLDTKKWGGVLHGSFSQAGTYTGRASSHDPNLQNIPAMIQGTTEDFEEEAVIVHQETLAKMLGAAVASSYTIVGKTYEADDWDEGDGSMVAARRALVPREGMVFIRADYDQMEMIAFICYVGNSELLKQITESYEAGKPLDFHNFITLQVWGLEPGDEGFKQARKAAKVLNFSMIYGAGIKKIASEIGVSVDEAKEYRKTYFLKIFGAERFIEDVHAMIEGRGWVKNLFGRRYNMDPRESYKAVNYLVQGSCADFLKNRMAALRAFLIENDSYILLQVHDELVFEVPRENVVAVAEGVKEILEKKTKFSISLPVSIEICEDSWLTGEKMQDWTPIPGPSQREGLSPEEKRGYENKPEVDKYEEVKA